MPNSVPATSMYFAVLLRMRVESRAFPGCGALASPACTLRYFRWWYYTVLLIGSLRSYIYTHPIQQQPGTVHA
ncbi:hypothetical protein F5B19DRAFT_476980 [Rostrohypoxylon terebratum]|nr:hypothetical protein F5B19DRAFT_476980 [Rostrohypoxylon terebratum]